MKKSFIAFALLAALALSLAACGSAPAAQPEPPAAEQPQIIEASPAQVTEQPNTSAPSEAAAAPFRQNGERFESVIMLEGMDETVHYEHIRSDAASIEMDYDYDYLVRKSGTDMERFLSVWDNPDEPENYLDVAYDAGNAELVAAAINANLSGYYETIFEYYTLGRAGRCIRIDASEAKGGDSMPQQLQQVWVIPTDDGCRVATAHYSIENAEGFGRRLAYMMETLSVIERNVKRSVSDEMALSAIQNHCYESIPDLAEIVNKGEYPVYWEIVSSDEQQVVVLFRSYTGAQLRYYIERSTGDTYVTEFVPGITTEEQRTDERLNVWDYMG